MEDVIITNQKEFEEKKNKIIKSSLKNLHFISDFDGTLTKSFVNGKRFPSLISLLRSSKHLSERYSKEAHALYDKYHPIEIDPKISREEKAKKMHEWWKKHFDLMIVCGLNLELIKKVIMEAIENKDIEMRDYAPEFLKKLHKDKVPLVIMSAGTGDLIKEFLLRKQILFGNMKIVANFLKFDKNGQVIGVKEPIIHSMNKTEFQVKDFDFFWEIEKRKKVILLGDKLEDLDMMEGFEPEILIKIGFLNENIEENLENFKKNFGIVILDNSIKFVLDLLKCMKT